MSTFEEEWAQLKRDTAPQTRLASADEEKVVGPMGGLSVTSAAWTKYSQVVGALRGSTQGCLPSSPRGSRAWRRTRTGSPA